MPHRTNLLPNSRRDTPNHIKFLGNGTSRCRTPRVSGSVELLPGTERISTAKKTSNGEIYDMYAMTAAHKTLPLGTYVQVHHLENNRKLEVRINDRGPFVRGRIIDLSYTAAKKLGLVGPGTAEVEIEALGTPAVADGGKGRTFVQRDYYSGNFTFQIGAFANLENAERLKRKLDAQYKNAHITRYDRGDKIFYRVRLGAFKTLEDAVLNEALLIQDGYADAFMVAE